MIWFVKNKEKIRQCSSQRNSFVSARSSPYADDCGNKTGRRPVDNAAAGGSYFLLLPKGFLNFNSNQWLLMTLRPFITLLFCTSLFLASCCTKKDCDSDEEIEELYLKNFTAEQVDTIRIFAYARNTGYTQVVDSLTVGGQAGSDERYVLHLQSFFSIHRDYKLKIPATGMTYTLSGFETSSEKCNFCFFTRDTYPRLAAYRVNGNRITNTRIELFP